MVPQPRLRTGPKGSGTFVYVYVGVHASDYHTDIRSTHMINRERKQTTNKPGFFSLLRPEAIATSEDKKFAATAQGVKKCVAFNLVLMYDVYGHGRAW